MHEWRTVADHLDVSSDTRSADDHVAAVDDNALTPAVVDGPAASLALSSASAFAAAGHSPITTAEAVAEAAVSGSAVATPPDVAPQAAASSSSSNIPVPAATSTLYAAAISAPSPVQDLPQAQPASLQQFLSHIWTTLSDLHSTIDSSYISTCEASKQTLYRIQQLEVLQNIYLEDRSPWKSPGVLSDKARNGMKLPDIALYNGFIDMNRGLPGGIGTMNLIPSDFRHLFHAHPVSSLGQHNEPLPGFGFPIHPSAVANTPTANPPAAAQPVVVPPAASQPVAMQPAVMQPAAATSTSAILQSVSISHSVLFYFSYFVAHSYTHSF